MLHLFDIFYSIFREKFPLHNFLEFRNIELSAILLHFFPKNINLYDDERRTPLHITVKNSNKKIVKFLIDHGADVNAKTYMNWTPLHIAVRKLSYRIVKLLVKCGADINACDFKGRPPLYVARVLDDIIQHEHIYKRINKLFCKNGFREFD